MIQRSFEDKFTTVEQTRAVFVLHVLFAVFLCLYSFLIIFSSKLLGFLFFFSGLILLAHTVWKGVKAVPSFVAVLTLLCFVFFSRVVWLEAFNVLPLYFYDIFQSLFFIVFGLGVILLYMLCVKGAKLTNDWSNYIVHGLYYLVGILLIPYACLYSYGAYIKGDTNKLFWIIFLLFLWGSIYLLQILCFEKRWIRYGLFTLNLVIGSWAFYRWILIFN